MPPSRTGVFKDVLGISNNNSFDSFGFKFFMVEFHISLFKVLVWFLLSRSISLTVRVT